MSRTSPPAAATAEIVLLGLGGTGVTFASRVLAEAAMAEGREAFTAETHGMSQRGGAVEAHVRIGPWESPLVRPGWADAALVLEAGRIPAARRLLRPGGLCVADAPAQPEGVLGCDASAEARALGVPRSANLVLLGFAARALHGLLPRPDTLLRAIARLSPPESADANRRAFLRGMELAP